MTPTEFAIFKYQHTGPVVRSRLRAGLCAAGVLLALLLGGVTGGPGLFALVIPVAIWFTVPRHLLLGPRYLLCGNSVVYYANVRRVIQASGQGKLRLVTASGRSFTLERDKFPTAARKPEKIAKNRAAKFDKVSKKLTERVRALAPEADFSGA